MTPFGNDLDALAAEFSARRGTLLATAYRLTGIRSDAEDAVQEAWLRLAGLDEDSRNEIRDLTAWLATVVGRICLDRLRSAHARREHYVGQWLPEPLVTQLDAPKRTDPVDEIVQREDLRLAAMVILDTLTPEQRVAFVLHDALSLPFDEIAGILECSPASARQHASRGRKALADADPPPRTSIEEQRQVLERFVAAIASGDITTLTELLHPDVVLIGDADGKARTARQVMAGQDKISRFLLGLRRMYPDEALTAATFLLVNGDLGLYVPPRPGSAGHRRLDAHLQTMALRDGRIVAIYDQANPDKLGAVPPAS